MKLELRRFSAGYGDNIVVREVDACFLSGSITGLIGPNGAGKSTLLKALFGTARLISGDVLIDGVVMPRVTPRELLHRGIAYVPQLRNVFSSMSVRENLQMGVLRQGQSIDGALSVFKELGPLLDRTAGKLSGGQRNMVAIARALVSEPRLLLVDEGSAGLAPQIADTYWRHLRNLADNGTGVVAVEQNVNFTFDYADRIYLLAGGEVKLEGTAEEIRQRSDVGQIFLGAEARAQSS